MISFSITLILTLLLLSEIGNLIRGLLIYKYAYPSPLGSNGEMLRRPKPASASTTGSVLPHAASAGTDIKAESSHIFADSNKIRLCSKYFGTDPSRPNFPLAPGR